MSNFIGAKIHISGIVQGVGFRPFVYNLAKRYSLKGWVRNTSAGVDIEVDGERQVIESFIQALNQETPALAKIDEFTVSWQKAAGNPDFEIIHSHPISEAFQPISPDISTCPECLKELFDPNDRRYCYPFINCTNCGPRFTIIKDIPYDRPATTMASFPMCPECRVEYSNPLDRRFHAQPIACPTCGPQVWLEEKTPNGLHTVQTGFPAIQETISLLKRGKIVAIKGLGGFHLACDAENTTAVAELRRRKLRVDKPFAIMMADLETIEKHCYLSPSEIELVNSIQKPIVILHRRPESTIAPEVAPHQNTLGVMLPYTPLHYLLFYRDENRYKDNTPMAALVMTSGNLSEEPIATDNDQARNRLGQLADAFLMHNRDIHIRCDDSVMRVFPTMKTSSSSPTNTQESAFLLPLRRSRGYAPFPVRLPWNVEPILAAGAELKNTFCITRDQYAFLSQHIGDMENYETLRSFEEGIRHFERLFRIQPQLLAYDLHPNYLASRYVLERAESEGIPAIGVQHHHAHIAACMAEHQLNGEKPVIGVSFDGTGFGEDGAIWGGEFLIANYQHYERRYHLLYVPLPGGDLAIREPWRMALAWLTKAGIEWSEWLPPIRGLHSTSAHANKVLEVVQKQITEGFNSPLTSSMGRLFDAVAATIGVCTRVNYEAQAAIELEALADDKELGVYPMHIPSMEFTSSSPQQIDVTPMFQAIIEDLQKNISASIIAARFHNSLADMVKQTCVALRNSTQISEVALSGGVWQNMTLLEKTFQLLVKEGFQVLIHQQVPTNDGGLALGQAIIAARKMAKVS